MATTITVSYNLSFYIIFSSSIPKNYYDRNDSIVGYIIFENTWTVLY